MVSKKDVFLQNENHYLTQLRDPIGLMQPEVHLFSEPFRREQNGMVWYQQEELLFQTDDVAFDRFMESGWRRSGYLFYRLTHFPESDGQYSTVLPLRIRLEGFLFSKSQLKIFKKNADLTYQIAAIRPTPEHLKLFELHKKRFKAYPPDSIYDYITERHERYPTKGMILNVFHDEKLVAASFIDVTTRSVSSIYGMFHPDYSTRSLGILTMLLEIQYSMRRGCSYYYPGFAYKEPSFYDYKKRFNQLEAYDWQGWQPYPRLQ
jgi:leucyl-tRNA---protein transferase